MRQALGGKATARPASKKKSVTRPAEKALNLSSSSSSHSSPLKEVGTSQDSTDLLSVVERLDQELEPEVPYINLEPEEEEEEKMTLRLGVIFKERQRKHIFEALLISSLLLKKDVRRLFVRNQLLVRSRLWTLPWCKCPPLMLLGLGKN